MLPAKLRRGLRRVRQRRGVRSGKCDAKIVRWASATADALLRGKYWGSRGYEKFSWREEMMTCELSKMQLDSLKYCGGHDELRSRSARGLPRCCGAVA
jgi:hypothetical protein